MKRGANGATRVSLRAQPRRWHKLVEPPARIDPAHQVVADLTSSSPDLDRNSRRHGAALNARTEVQNMDFISHISHITPLISRLK